MKLVTSLLLSALALQSASTPTKPEIAQAVRGAAALQDAMRDPDSFLIEKVFTLTNKKGVEITCFEYRSRNGFGGMNRDMALYTEYKGKPHVDLSGLYGHSCTATKSNPYVDITNEFRDAEKAEKQAKLKSSN